MMRFRLLGPLEVRAGEDWKEIGAPKWRSLLAVLLIRAGQVVPVDVLISEPKSRTFDGLWLREPGQFLQDALPRARAFLDRFPAPTGMLFRGGR